MLLAVLVATSWLACAFAQNATAGYTITRSHKRGLVWVSGDDTNYLDIWNSDKVDLNWYYDYSPYPTSGLDGDKFEYVPMMWGAGPEHEGFTDEVKGLLSGGMYIKYVLGFNEPDGCFGGGSCVSPKKAAKTWKKYIEPLKHEGVELGAPAVIAGNIGWMQEFDKHCDGDCTIDFIPLHYYGESAGLASWISTIKSAYPGTPLWVTEFAYANTTLAASEQFLVESLALLDAEPAVKRYSYFGAYRSDESPNVGPNPAFLTKSGQLTDIGAWYLGLKGPKASLSGGVAGFAISPWWTMLAVSATVVMFMRVW